MSASELGCIYSAMILADDNVAITSDKLCSLMKAAGIDYEPWAPVLYSKALSNCDIKDLITQMGSGAGSAPIATSATSAPAATEDKTEGKGGKKKEEAKKEESDESDADMGFEPEMAEPTMIAD